MAKIVGIVDGWDQAQAAATVARRYFLASSALLGVALTALWWPTGATTMSGIVPNAPAVADDSSAFPDEGRRSGLRVQFAGGLINRMLR